MKILLITGFLEALEAKNFFNKVSREYVWSANNKSVHCFSDYINMWFWMAREQGKAYVFSVDISWKIVSTHMLSEEEIKKQLDETLVRFDVVKDGEDFILKILNSL